MVTEKIKKPPKTKKEKLNSTKINNVSYNDINIIDSNVLAVEIDNDIKYSLMVDPENKYNMSATQKEFIKNYVQFKNVNAVSTIMKIPVEEVIGYLKLYSSTQEINRINTAIYVRNFNRKMLTLDQIGGYLTSIIMDQVPEGDKISTKDKLSVAKLLIELNQMKVDIHNNPTIIDELEIEKDIKELSVKSIKQLLTGTNENSLKDKEDIINQINKDNLLSPEEISVLNSLSTKELLNLLNEINGKDMRK